MYQTTTWQRVERRLAKVLNRRMCRMQNAGGLVSFSFDDVPASACRTGLSILERHGALGTFYVCGSLTDTVAPEGEMHTHADLKRLQSNGHEIGSHGFAHLNYQHLSVQRAYEDICANRAFFAENGMDKAGATFAYPFGCASLRSKALIAQEFACARITEGGVNLKTMDLGLLKAVPLYSGRTTEQAISASLKRTAAAAGWLIFYTHDVCDSPGRYGCTPRLLEFAAREARHLGLTVLPVQDALRLAASTERQ